MQLDTIYQGDALLFMKEMERLSIAPDLVVTSPPYWMARDYGSTLGREPDPRDYIAHLLEYMAGIKRILKPTGSLYLVLGDTFFGPKGVYRLFGCRNGHYKNAACCKPDGRYLQHGQQLMLPARVAIAMQDEGWLLRNPIIWRKTNPIPNSYSNRRIPCHEYIFHFVKSKRYYFDYAAAEALDFTHDYVEFSTNQNQNESAYFHPATFPNELARQLILTTSREGDLVYDPFAGGSTACIEAKRNRRHFLGCDLNKEYVEESNRFLSLIPPDDPHLLVNPRTFAEPFDFYATPPEPVHALMQAEDFKGTIWEPCAGQLDMVKVLQEYNDKVYYSDVLDYGGDYPLVNFLSVAPYQFRPDNIITNPPYQQLHSFISQALKLAKRKVALLVRGDSLGNCNFVREHLKTIHQITFRIQFRRLDDSLTSPRDAFYQWAVWERGYKGKVETRFLDPPEK